MGHFLHKTQRCFANNKRLFAKCNYSDTSVASVAMVFPSNQIPPFPIGAPRSTRTQFLSIWLSIRGSGSNIHWKPSHESWCHDNAIHHSKPSIVSSEYLRFTQCPFGCSPNLSKISLQRWILNAAIGTNERGPAKVAIVADQIHTSILLDISPTNILIITFTNPFEHNEHWDHP